MKVTNEEIEVLNKASEIFLKYADQANLTQEDLYLYERLMVTIIDGIDNEEKINVENNVIKVEEPKEKVTYPTTKWRIPDSLFQRDKKLELEYGIEDIKLYGYYENTNSLYIVGEIISKALKNPFYMNCTIYDKDGDIIKTEECSSYGEGLATSYIYPEAFFSGFPFKFYLGNVQSKKIKQILINPVNK